MELGVPVAEDKPVPPIRNLGVWGMVFIGFFWVSGGGYGNETLISNGPPAMVISLCLAIPLMYCLPISFMVAELSTAISADSGPTVWATRVSNYTIGMHNAYWSVLAWIVDSAAYPVVAAEYVVSREAACSDQNSRDCLLIKSGVASAMVFAVTALKLGGLDFIVKFSTVLAVGALLPPVAFMLGGLPKLEPANWVATSGAPVSLLPLISWMLWINSGFFGVGALAGQVKEPIRTTFLLSTLMLALITVTCILLPLLVSYSMDTDANNYSPGYFGTLSSRIYGGWMFQCYQVGAVLSNVGLYNAQMIQSEVAAMYVVKELFPDMIRPWTEKAIVVLCGVITMALVWLPYDLLVQSSMLLFAPPSLLIFFSFFALRVKEPHLPRPFKVPGGWPIAIAVSVFPVMLTLANVALNMDPWQDGFEIRASVFAGMLALGIGLQMIPCMNRRCRENKEPLQPLMQHPGD